MGRWLYGAAQKQIGITNIKVHQVMAVFYSIAPNLLSGVMSVTQLCIGSMIPRITSYNVCYTKLLRNNLNGNIKIYRHKELPTIYEVL